MLRLQESEIVESEKVKLRLSSSVQLSWMEMPSKAWISDAVLYALGMTEVLHPDNVRVGNVPVMTGLMVSMTNTCWEPREVQTLSVYKTM